MGIFTFNNLLSAVKTNGLSESFLPPMILNMSITASVIILFVLLARLALKKAPKIFSYALWAVVLFRLLCPVSVTTDFSLLGLFDTPAVENTQHTTAVEYIPYDVVHTPTLEVQLPVPPAINDAVNDTLPQEHAVLGADPLEGEFAIGSLIWLLGIAAMAIYSAVSYFLLRRKLVGSVLLRDNIYLADGIGSPFVMGFIRPKIYLPSALSEQEQSYIILHEQHHIRRGDHIIKALAFIALCIHWFNPLVWVAFVLSSKDMEMSCDEAVVKKLGEEIRADYSASLLSLATGKRIIAGTPLAFGEGDTKSRIKNMLNWKQAKPAVIFLSAAAVILAILVCGTNQKDYTRTAEEDTAAYLYRLRGSYHMDSDRVEKMLDALEMEELGEYSFQGVYRSEGGLFPRKCYEVKLEFPNQPDREAVFTEEMDHRACILLGLIPNLEMVSWAYPRNDDTMTSAYFYSALDRESGLGAATIGDLCKTEDGLRKLLLHWNLMPHTPEEDTTAAMIDWEVEENYPDAVIECVKDYVAGQIRYYNELGSGENAIGGEYSILEAKVVGFKSMEPAPYDETRTVGLYLLEYRLLPSEPDHVVLAGGMQMEDGWITEWGSTGQPYLALMTEENGKEDIWTLVCVTNDDSIQFDYGTEEMIARYGSKYIAAAMELYEAYLRSTTQTSYGTATDVSYYLELAAGETFQDMSLEKQVSLLVEYEDLLDDYTLIARESKDGTTAYIVGQYNGNPLESPLHGMYSIDMYTGEEEYFRFLYREDEVETVEAVVAANKTEFPPSTGYRIEDSVISWTENSGVILIQPKENTLLLDVPWNRYFYTPNGREYIADAVSRGIDVCGRTDTFLYVYRISERFGEIAERIALTEAEAQAILAEERVSITDGFGFSASLHIDGQTTYYNEREGIPQTVLDLAVEKCDYRFGDPSYITDTIREARLDCDWLDTTLYADEADLPRLREILKNAEHGYVGSCGYGAKLTLTFTGGEKLTVFKGCDGCDTIVFGSYGGYFLGEQENIEFWEMFGLDPDTKERIEGNPNGRELLYKDEEILISVPAQYAHLVKMDGLYSDDQYTNKANFYYKPEYFEHEAYAAPLNGGWMLTVSTTLPSFAEATWAGHIGTCWTKDGSRVYVEQRPVNEFNCSAANLAEFKAVMDSIQVEYIGLKSFEAGYLLPTQQLSATEQAAAVNAIFTNLKTGWWNGDPLKNCAYESAAFECLHREVNGNIVNLYGYGGYFRWDRSKTCIEQWYAPTMVTLDTDTQQVLDLWWPGDGAAYESSILDKFPAEIGSTVATPNSDRSTTVRNNLMEASKESMVSASQQSESGQTRRFGVQDLRVEVTNVLSTHKTALLAEGIALHEYVVVSCTPESKITVLDAGMSDPTYAEDGKPHPQWGLLYTGETKRTRITDETGTVPVTSDLEGIYNLEASLFVIQLNLVD